MTTELEAQQGREELLRAYTPTERITVTTVRDLASTTNANVTDVEILQELDQMICSYDIKTPVEHRMLLQLQTLDALFHYSVHAGCKQNPGFFKDAFIAQKLFCETAKVLNGPTLPVPNSKTDY